MGLRQSAIKGISWTMVGAVSMAAVQILRPAILTRFLEKSDFGLMAILMLVLGFTQIFSDLGVSVALFSIRDITKREYSSLYWFGIIVAVLLYFIMVISSPMISWFYQMPDLVKLIPILGLDLIISVAGRQFQVFRQKEMKFKSLAVIDITSAVVSFVLAVFLAYKGFGIYSLIYSALASAICKTALLILLGISTHPLSFCLDIKKNKKFYRIGLFQSGSQVLDYIASQMDVILIGKFLNSSDLGVYNLIKQLIVRPYGLINSVITNVSIPLLSSVNNQLERLKTLYLEMIRLVAFINVPMYALIAIFSEDIIKLIYGESYLMAVPVLQVLCLWGASASITSAASSIVTIRGRTDLGFVWTIFRVLTNPLAIIIGYKFGLLGIAVANSIICLIYVLVYYKILIVRNFKELKFKEYFNSFADLFVEGGLMAFGYYFFFLSNVFVDSSLLLKVIVLLFFVSGFLFINKKIVRKYSIQYLNFNISKFKL